MKRLLALLLCLPLLAGCSSLIPKPVEFFQDKVHKVPSQKASERETQRQTAQRAAEKAQEVLDSALIGDCSPAVVAPAKEVTQLTGAVARSLGPPVSPSTLTSEELSRKLDKAIAKLNQRLDEFKADNDENAGKKIEGSGAFSIPYFFWIMIIGGVVFLAFLVLKTVVHVAAAGNPAVGVGLQAVQLGGRGAAALAKEVIEGGKLFRARLAKEMPEIQAKVDQLFTDSQRQKQSTTNQDVVKKLTS